MDKRRYIDSFIANYREITIARVFECMGDDSKYDEEIKIQNQKINEAKDLQAKQR